METALLEDVARVSGGSAFNLKFRTALSTRNTVVNRGSDAHKRVKESLELPDRCRLEMSMGGSTINEDETWVEVGAQDGGNASAVVAATPVQGGIRLTAENGPFFDEAIPSNGDRFLKFAEAVEMRGGGGDWGMHLYVKPLSVASWEEFLEARDVYADGERHCTGLDVERKFLGLSAGEALWDQLYALGRIFFSLPHSCIDLKVPPFAGIFEVQKTGEEVMEQARASDWTEVPTAGHDYTEQMVAKAEAWISALLEVVGVHGSLAEAMVPGAGLPVKQVYCDGWNGNGGRVVFATAEFCFDLNYCTS